MENEPKRFIYGAGAGAAAAATFAARHCFPFSVGSIAHVYSRFVISFGRSVVHSICNFFPRLFRDTAVEHKCITYVCIFLHGM